MSDDRIDEIKTRQLVTRLENLGFNVLIHKSNIKFNRNTLLSFIICCVIWCGLGYDRYIEYYHDIDNIKNEVNNLSLLISEQINVSIFLTDQFIILHDNFNNNNNIELAKKFILLNPYTKYLNVYDKNGYLKLSTQTDNIKNINFSDRLWFQESKKMKKLFISPIIKSRITDDYVIPFSRGIYNDKNEFDGVINITMNLEYFNQFYKDLNLGKYGYMTLIGMDGYYRFKKILGKTKYIEMEKSEITYPIYKTNNFINGVYFITGRDKISRYIGIYKLKNYPLFLAIGLSYNEYMTKYFIETFILFLLGIFFTSLIIYLINLERKSNLILQHNYDLLENKTKIIKQQNEELAIQYKNMIALKEHVEKSDKLKSKFISNMSHELRTPLNIIIGYSDLLSTFDLSDKIKEQLNNINSAGNHLLDMITSILEISKIDSNNFQFNYEHYYVYETIRECCELFELQIVDKNIKLDFEENKFIIYADRIRFRQVLMNLISNSIKFTHKGKISINAFEIGKYINITIEDTGIGMDESGIEISLQPFGQVNTELNKTHQGTGLGLPLSKKIIESMGGIFEIKSELNVGTIVNIQLSKGDIDKVTEISVF